jgi:DNA-binding PadR family transcriptional regulator
MQEATFLILTALADGSQHGYGIITEVRQISGGRVKLRAGTLYTALDRLRTDGLVAVDGEEIVEGRLRRYYRLTPDGTTVLAEEAARLHANAAAALRRLNPARRPVVTVYDHTRAAGSLPARADRAVPRQPAQGRLTLENSSSGFIPS